jgi:hypothetical protein
VAGFLFELLFYVFIEFLFYVVFFRIGQLTIFLFTLGKNLNTYNLNQEWVSVIGFLVCAAPIAFFTFT